MQRRPRQPGGGSDGGSYLRLAESLAQAVAEIRALTGWLLAEGCPGVAVWGLSMGGWLAGLTVCRDARLSAAVLTAPAVRMNDCWVHRLVWPRLRKAMEGQRVAYDALNQTALNLTMSRSAIPTENILLIEPIYDLCAGSEPVEDLWRAWQEPEIWRLPTGHIGLGFSPGWSGRVVRWLAQRLDARSDHNSRVSLNAVCRGGTDPG